MSEVDPDLYAVMRSAILALDLLPGERLSERALGERYGGSRTPVRAALMRLENDGLVCRDGSAWKVSPIDLTEIRAISEYREVVEIAALQFAIERASDHELSALLQLAREASEQEDTGEVGLREGRSFHLSVAQLSGNPFLVSSLRNAITRLGRVRWLEVRTEESRLQARSEHLAIAEAAVTRNLAEATRLAREHLQGSRERTLGLLSDEYRRLRGRGYAIVETTPAPGEAAP